jgi:hypothetical protein
VAEIRAAIVEHLEPRELFATALVCRSWALSATWALWRQPAPGALRLVSADRRDIYGPAIVTLKLTEPTIADAAGAGWRFPRVKKLDLHYSVIDKPAVLAALLERCGPRLDTVLISAHLNDPDEPDDYIDDDFVDVVDYYDQLDRRVLQLLAERAGLADVSFHEMHIGRACVEHVRSCVAAPFAHLTRLGAVIDAAVADAFLSLPAAPALVELDLFLASGRGPVVQAVARHQPQIQELMLWFTTNDCAFTAADYFTLHRLTGLESLGILGVGFRMSAAQWRAWLCGLPKLWRLDIGFQGIELPPDAWVTAGACCRRLLYLELHVPSDLSAAEAADGNDSVAAAPLFPELQALRLGSETRRMVLSK